jgi:heme/copper-type cytochrome/quinol oxidase subunit 3
MSASQALASDNFKSLLSVRRHSTRRAKSNHDSEKRIVVGYGFWIFLISDIIMFSAFFASYAVLTDSTSTFRQWRSKRVVC